jgi:hypothetical protein
MKERRGEAAVRLLLQALVLALPAFLLWIRPFVVYRCELREGAVSCVIERRAGGLVRLGRTDIAGIRRATGETATRRFTTHEPGRPRETYTASSTVGTLVLLDAEDRILYSEEQDNSVGCRAECLADAINALAEGRRAAPLLVWHVTWITALFATILLALMVPPLIGALASRLGFLPPPPSEAEAAPGPLTSVETRFLRALLPLYVVWTAICAMAWALLLSGGFPAALAKALGAPPGV